MNRSNNSRDARENLGNSHSREFRSRDDSQDQNRNRFDNRNRKYDNNKYYGSRDRSREGR